MSFTTKSRIKMQSGSGMKQKNLPETSRKPMPSVEKLSTDLATHLDNIMNGGLMRKVTPLYIEARLLNHGYIRRAIGGLMPTEAGHKALMQWQRGRKK